MYFINGASCDKILHETHNSKSYMVIQFTSLYLSMGDICVGSHMAF